MSDRGSRNKDNPVVKLGDGSFSKMYGQRIAKAADKVALAILSPTV